MQPDTDCPGKANAFRSWRQYRRARGKAGRAAATAVAANSATTAYLLNLDGLMWKTFDGGTSWNHAAAGLQVSTVAESQSQPATLFAVTPAQLERSDDGGGTWDRAHTAVRQGAGCQHPHTKRGQPFAAVSLAQPHNAQAGAKPCWAWTRVARIASTDAPLFSRNYPVWPDRTSRQATTTAEQPPRERRPPDPAAGCHAGPGTRLSP